MGEAKIRSCCLTLSTSISRTFKCLCLSVCVCQSVCVSASECVGCLGGVGGVCLAVGCWVLGGHNGHVPVMLPLSLSLRACPVP